MPSVHPPWPCCNDWTISRSRSTLTWSPIWIPPGPVRDPGPCSPGKWIVRWNYHDAKLFAKLLQIWENKCKTFQQIEWPSFLTYIQTFSYMSLINYSSLGFITIITISFLLHYKSWKFALGQGHSNLKCTGALWSFTKGHLKSRLLLFFVCFGVHTRKKPDSRVHRLCCYP